MSVTLKVCKYPSTVTYWSRFPCNFWSVSVGHSSSTGERLQRENVLPCAKQCHYWGTYNSLLRTQILHIWLNVYNQYYSAGVCDLQMANRKKNWDKEKKNREKIWCSFGLKKLPDTASIRVFFNEISMKNEWIYIHTGIICDECSLCVTNIVITKRTILSLGILPI